MSPNPINLYGLGPWMSPNHIYIYMYKDRHRLVAGGRALAKPYKSIGFGDMDVTKPYEFMGSGAMDVTKPNIERERERDL